MYEIYMYVCLIYQNQILISNSFVLLSSQEMPDCQDVNRLTVDCKHRA